MTFSEWSFQQVVMKGHTISSIKGDDGLNIAWVNNKTGEKFIIKKGDEK